MSNIKLKENELTGFSKLILEKLRKEENKATTICLYGVLGSGKTTFTKYLGNNLGIKENITSPTFLLIKKYNIPKKEFGFKNLYHVDAYRLESGKDLENLNINKIINNSDNLVIIEWPEKVKKILPKNCIKINFEHGKNPNKRIIKYSI
ncbi:MAG: tRNA (adenosine(37)-N6)-threonylcarbamoyltransferase complex ATPase subunit type 1 TsaE [Candidatus Paceibacterota bacterium]